jgi:Family of unknown function (DUF5681)
MSHDDGENKKVGYGVPPEHTRFKPGHSGNPRGRKPQFGSFEADLIEELNAEISVRENGRERKISNQKAIIRAVIKAAVDGNMRAASALLGILVRSSPMPAEPESESSPVNDDDQKLVKRFRRRDSRQSTTAKNLPAKEPDGDQ